MLLKLSLHFSVAWHPHFLFCDVVYSLLVVFQLRLSLAEGLGIRVKVDILPRPNGSALAGH